jgi:hypothetical protein
MKWLPETASEIVKQALREAISRRKRDLSVFENELERILQEERDEEHKMDEQIRREFGT